MENLLLRTDSDNTDFKSLVLLLDKDLAIKDGDEHAFYDQFNKITNIRYVVVCYENDLAVACGAFKEYDKECTEIKRMFVLPLHRGKGLAGKVLQELEAWALEVGYTFCILETGKKQPEAISLYKKTATASSRITASMKM